jgi:hypothetical protein
MIIHLHSNSAPLHFLQIEHIIRCINYWLAKIIFIKSTMKASLVVSQILKWTYTKTNEYNLENTCLKHNANLKWKLNMIELTSHESSPIYGNSQIKWSPFHTPFFMKILFNFGYPNIFKAHCIRDLASSN